jgi:transcriptional regulator with XRE-family HTH domain
MRRTSIEFVPRKAKKPAKHPALQRLGARIRKLREERDLSQEALADAAHIGRSYMSGIERGVRNCSTLHLLRLARALRVTVGDLFTK